MSGILNSFFLVFVSEMGDRTQLMALILASRFRRPWVVLAGITSASLVNHALAAWAGAEAQRLVGAERMNWILALIFFACAVWTLLPESEEEEKKEYSASGAFVTTFIVFFFAEMGDKTQLATAALGARYDSLVMVTVASTAGLVVADALAVFLGDRFHQRLPMKWIKVGASMLFFLFGLYLLVFKPGITS